VDYSLDLLVFPVWVFLLKPETMVQRKKDRLKSIVNKLLSSVPARQRLDLSYLLHAPTGKRQSRKPAYLQQFLVASKVPQDGETATLTTAT